ncbi:MULTISPECIES: HNH endonuclease family protein [Streptomyces]|uniref:HNH endonuclease family protein n=1 Tax=Streptomyces changanensis TaxID=2964669 RepID=A0ABY5N5K4_9ACTN|nr:MULTISPECIES: HNH endonuclease family protein [Streptomyces]UUS31476.1 HNH endonuclease family protein [Streptomyces changanensis]
MPARTVTPPAPPARPVRRARRRTLPAAVLAAAALAVGCTPQPPDAGGGAPGGGSGAGGPALAAVDTLTVKGRAPKTGYAREEFGRAWADTDGNGCGTREDILARDATDVRYQDGERCRVARGVLPQDPYTGRRIVFARGDRKVDIDHVVALSDAWQKGARQWDAGKRLRFANDPLNLLAVDASANRRKGDGDTATWLPPSREYRCRYVARQVAVKKKYGVWVTAAERDAMKRVLNGCPGERLP